MQDVWFVAAILLRLAVIATPIAIWFKLSTLVITTFFGAEAYGETPLAAWFLGDLGTLIALDAEVGKHNQL